MKRLVLKVGSSVLNDKYGLNKNNILNLVKLIAKLKEKGLEVILVSSGSVACGYGKININKKSLGNKQCLAAIGQPILMSTYREFFNKLNLECAQLLMGKSDFDSRKAVKYTKNALKSILKANVIPIFNENDVTEVKELIFGDNDRLSASITHYFNADMLVILSDINAYFDKNPRKHKDAKALKIVSKIDKKELKQNINIGYKFASGGIVTKLKSANFLMKKKKKMFLCSGINLADAKSFLLNKKHKGGTLFKRDSY